MPELITYPSSINTDLNKLCAVYSLIEQMRLEHNRVGAIARSDWGRYKGKWYLYALRHKRLGGSIFWDKMLPLLQEQNRLRDSIRKKNYSDTQWKQLTEEERDVAHLQLFGDRKTLKVIPTQAECGLLDELKSISLDSLGGAIPPDPTEDFTTYDYSDTGGDLTITADRITVDTLPRNLETYVRDAHTISGDFEHWLYYSCGTFGANARIVWWAVSGEYATWYNFYDNYEGIGVYCTGAAHNLVLYDFASRTYDGAGAQSTGYLIVDRTGTTATCKLYSDTWGGTLVDTLTLSCPTDSYTHVFGLANYGGGSGAETSGYVEHLDLQEAAPPTEKSSGDSGSGVESKASGNPVAMIAQTETGTGVEDTPIQMAALIKSESGGGVDSRLSLLASLTRGESGSGVEQSLLSLLLSSSEAGSGAEAVVYLLSELLQGDSGSGVECIAGRDLSVPDSVSGTDALLALLAAVPGSETGSGAEQSLLSMIMEKLSSETGSGAEAAALIMSLVSADEGTGSELGILPMKTIPGSDGGSGYDALRALSRAAGSDVKLPDGRGQVRMPSKGVNL